MPDNAAKTVPKLAFGLSIDLLSEWQFSNFLSKFGIGKALGLRHGEFTEARNSGNYLSCNRFPRLQTLVC